MTEVNLFKQRCFACSIDTLPLEPEDMKLLIKELKTGWKIIDNNHLIREFKFKDFKDALAFVNSVGAIAEEEGHHPDIELHWGRVVITLMTHKIKGLSHNDFILASKIDQIH